MSIKTLHPLYDKFACNWETLRDFYAGADEVRAKGVRYLPATEGMQLDGMDANQMGRKAYEAYKLRARVPDYVKEAVEILVGLLHQKDAIVELPPELEYLRAGASINKEPLSALHRRINVEQLTTGRLGLLVDMPRTPDPANPQPYLSLYIGESILNWDATTTSSGQGSLNMVLLDESGPQRDGMFDWVEKERYRVLVLGDDIKDEITGDYRVGVFQDNLTYSADQLMTPKLRGKVLEEIPFTFINSKDLLPEPDVPPLKGLAEICVGIYQGEADYRQNLYMQSQETLVVIGGVRNATAVPGGADALRTGAGARIDVDVSGDAKYIGVTSNGLSEQRTALENDRARAERKSGQLIQNTGSQMESGTAMTTRFNAQTATLNQLATTAAAGLESAIRNIAVWMGADPTKVKVTPNVEFIDFNLDGRNFVDIMTARQMGLPISIESLHAKMAERGMTTLDFVTEMKHIEEENKKFGDLLPKAAAPGAAPVAPAPAPAPDKKDPKPTS